MELLYGINPVMEALRARRRRVREVLVVRREGGGRIEEVVAAARAAGVPVRRVEPAEMARRFTHRDDQGVAAEADPYPYETLEEIVRARPRPALIVALDEVQDPRNVGAVIRSAAAFGCAGLVIHKDRSAQVTPAAVKTSAGMSERVRVARVVNLAAALRALRGEGMRVVGLDGEGETPLDAADLAGDVVLVLGSEEKGMRRLTAELCDLVARIPIAAGCESLNVSTAAAVALYEAARQRGGKAGNGTA